jgi:hypothetical protein
VSTSRAGRKRRPAWKLRIQDEDAIVAGVMAESMEALLNEDTGYNHGLGMVGACKGTEGEETR